MKIQNKALGKIAVQFRAGMVAAGCALVLVLGAPAVQGAGSQQLHGQVPAAAAHLAPVDRLAGSKSLDLAIGLPLRNPEALANLLQELYDPASPNYHHFLTPEQFTGRFGPTEEDYQAVIAFAEANGLKVTGTHPNRLLVDVHGPVANIESALHVTLRVYQHPQEARTFYAPDVEPSLDLMVPVLRISGLNNYSLPRPRLQLPGLNNEPQATSNSGSGPNGGYMGSDFRAAYAPGVALNGAGQAVGLLQFDGYTASDITYYESQAGLPNVTLSNVLIDGASGNPSGGGGEVEVSLDIEMAISMAPGLSRVIVYMAPNPSPWEDLLNRMANDNLAKQLSCSWYEAGGGSNPVADQIFQQMAAQGQSFFNASGDYDAYTGLIDFPGDTPYLTQVGGTTLSTTGPGGAWTSETVWNWGNGIGSGGGISTQYPIPSWQTNINMTANQGSTTMRNTPDVALTADNVYVRADGANHNVGGTSCAAPLWAGFAALINQQAVAGGRPAVGFINPAVSALGAKPNYATCFHDITTGNNTSGSSPAKFYAVTGYDLCTGWGTPGGQNLINALANPEALLITPATGFSSTGGAGGPFTITSQSLSLTNAGTNSLNWTLANTSLWLNASPGSGTLTPGGPAATVTVSLNSAASNLLVGTYSATVWFTNLNSGAGQARWFTLAVISPPAITAQPADQAVLEGATATFTVAATGGLPLSYQWRDNGTNLTDGNNVSGSTTTNLTINNVSVADVGTYTVVVTNLAGAATSSNAFLTITSSPPVIILQPVDQTAVVGQTAAFTVAAIGSKPFSYQWSFNGTNLVGATNATLTLTNVQLSQAGYYSVDVSNVLGSATSSNATLTVLLAPPCDPVPSGLIAWWPGEGNGLDIIGTNNGGLEGGLGFASGEVGQAFYFNNTNAGFKVPASSSLNVGAGNGFTLEAWINPSDISQLHPLFEWNVGNGVTYWGVHFYVSASGTGSLYANIVDGGGSWHIIHSATGVVTNGVFQHVALVYDKASGVAAIYYNGMVVAQQNVGSFTPLTTYSLYLGRRPGPDAILTFAGLLDEPSVYNRALSSNEIAAIYNAGSGGKCAPTLFPVIIVQPTNQTVNAGSPAAFTVVASGQSPLAYQWHFNGTNINGATNSVFTLVSAQFTDAGAYSVLVTNLYGAANSSNAVLTVAGVPPSITSQPSNQTVIAGANAAFNVTVIGTPPLSYQWSFNGTNVAGATNALLTLTNVQFGQAGNYAVVATNAFGSVTSSNAVLTVGVSPGIATQPANSTNVVGTTASFTVVANGSDPLIYQWKKNGANITGATDTNCLIINVQTNDTGVYSVVVTNLFGSITSSNATLTVLAPPVIIIQPTNQSVVVSNSALFAVVAGGTTPLNYQWDFNGTNILGATNSSLLLTNVQFSQTGAYAVTITNNYGSAASSNAILTVNPPPSCDSAPSGLVAWWPAENNANDIVGTNNGTLQGGLSFTNGEIGRAFLFNTTTAAVKIAASPGLNVGAGAGFTIECWIDPSDVTQLHPIVEWNTGSGTYGVHFYISVSGVGNLYANIVGSSGSGHTLQTGTGVVTSNVFQHVALTYDRASGAAKMYCNGAVVLQQSVGSFTPQTTYDLYLGRRPGEALEWAGLMDEVTIYNRALTTAEIQAIYSAGSSGKCPLPPTILVQPSNETVLAGATATFSVGANGTSPLFYQWSFNGTNMAGATNASLTLTNVQPVQAGPYAVQVANVAGATNSANAVLTVNTPPVITTQPASATNIVGTTASFTVVASGSTPLNYQWKKNGTNITGATGTNLTLVAVQTNDAAAYSVAITNTFGSIISSNAVLKVNLMFHFAWNQIPSPRFVNTPIAVVVQALDATNGVATNFTSTVFLLSTNGVPVSPAVSGNFVQGVWTGAVMVAQTATNFVLRASDTFGGSGLANPVNIVNLPSLTTFSSSGNLYIAWPVNPSGFNLETTTEISPTRWVPVTTPPFQIGGQNVLFIQISGTNAFYRLRLSAP
jgi:hypothetical protein